jgi:hypothetical protein
LVYLDKGNQTLWRCQIAPPEPVKYNIFIFVNEKNNQDQRFSTSAVQFDFDVNRLTLPSISYPHTWSHFFDYNLEIIKPMNSRYIDWFSNNNHFFCEILVRSPNNVCVSAIMKDTSKGSNVENGTLINFDHENNLWQCFFALSNTGVPFELTLFDKRLNEDESY